MCLCGLKYVFLVVVVVGFNAKYNDTTYGLGKITDTSRLHIYGNTYIHVCIVCIHIIDVHTHTHTHKYTYMRLLCILGLLYWYGGERVNGVCDECFYVVVVVVHKYYT